MAETEEIKEKVEDIASHASDYLDTWFRLTLLTIAQKITQVASAALSIAIVCILGLFVLFFAGLGLGWWLGNIVNSRAGGFLIVAGFWLLLAGILLLLRRKIIFPFIRNKIIRKIYD